MEGVKRAVGSADIMMMVVAQAWSMRTVSASVKQSSEMGVVVLQAAWSAPMQGCIEWLRK